MPSLLRLATLADATRLLELEDDAGRLYATAGLPPDLPGLTHDEVAGSIATQATWVIADDTDRPIAFALCQRRPQAMHLRELDVASSHMRRGLGRRLVEHVCDEARRSSLDAVTLTTFRDVAWNAPLYSRWGFSVLPAPQQPQWLANIRDDENRGPLAAWPRVAMMRTVSPVGSGVRSP